MSETNSTTLVIRYANPSTTPAVYGAQGYGLGVPVIQPGLVDGGDYWTVIGPRDRIVAHITAALNANDVNDYRIEQKRVAA